MAGIDPELIVSMIRSIVLLTLHKEEIGDERYQATIELLIGVLAEGMTSLKNNKIGGA